MKDAAGIKEYHSDGKVEWDIPIRWLDARRMRGLRHAIARNYYPSGQLKIERPYVDGNIEGVERMFYPDGTLWSETPYVSSKKSGMARVFHQNGNLSTEMEYVDDQRHGMFRRFDEADGSTIILEQKFINGKGI